MTNASDGGKGDPLDPPNAHISTDPHSPYPPAAHGAKNDQVTSVIDQDLLNYSPTRPTAGSVRIASLNQASALDNNEPSLTDNTALKNSSPTAYSAKNDPVSLDIDADMDFLEFIQDDHTVNDDNNNNNDSTPTDTDDDADDTTITTKHNNSPGTIRSPSIAAYRLLYSTDSELDYGP